MSLFSSYRLGRLELPNRIVMAPMTRCRAIGGMPNALMREYYTQRASAGLIITRGHVALAQWARLRAPVPESAEQRSVCFVSTCPTRPASVATSTQAHADAARDIVDNPLEPAVVSWLEPPH
jgi:hypothetical protein